MKSIWIFQSNPKIYDVYNEEITKPRVKKGNWTISQFKNQIKKGDIALLWISGNKKIRGIYGIVDIISDPHYEEGNPEVWVDYRYRTKLKQPFLDSEIQKISGLSELSIINNYRKTNYPVTKAEWELLQKEIKKRKLEIDSEKNTVDVAAEKTEKNVKLEISSLPEGNEKIVVQTIKERDPELRQMAIQYHGTKCAVCGFSFTQKYGKIGEGFIEIHHRKPISQFKRAVKVNPKKDLIPVCSNCHRMIHKPKDMLSIDQLRKMIKS